MAEMVVFAVVLGLVLVISSVVTMLITMCLFTNKHFLVWYIKRFADVYIKLISTVTEIIREEVDSNEERS